MNFYNYGIFKQSVFYLNKPSIFKFDIPIGLGKEIFDIIKLNSDLSIPKSAIRDIKIDILNK